MNRLTSQTCKKCNAIYGQRFTPNGQYWPSYTWRFVKTTREDMGKGVSIKYKTIQLHTDHIRYRISRKKKPYPAKEKLHWYLDTHRIAVNRHYDGFTFTACIQPTQQKSEIWLKTAFSYEICSRSPRYKPTTAPYVIYITFEADIGTPVENVLTSWALNIESKTYMLEHGSTEGYKSDREIHKCVHKWGLN